MGSELLILAESYESHGRPEIAAQLRAGHIHESMLEALDALTRSRTITKEQVEECAKVLWAQFEGFDRSIADQVWAQLDGNDELADQRRAEVEEHRGFARAAARAFGLTVQSDDR